MSSIALGVLVGGSVYDNFQVEWALGNNNELLIMFKGIGSSQPNTLPSLIAFPG